MQDVNKVLAKIGAGKPAVNQTLQEVLKTMPMAKKTDSKKPTPAAKMKEPSDPCTPIVKRAVPRAVKQVAEHKDSNKTTRLALREIDSGEFVSAKQAKRDPENVATDFVSLPPSLRAKKAVKKKASTKKAAPKKAVKKTAPAAQKGKSVGKVTQVAKKTPAKKSKSK